MFRKFNYNSTCRRQIVHCDGKLDLIVNKNLAGRRESANLETAILKRSNTRGGTMFRRVISKYISPIEIKEPKHVDGPEKFFNILWPTIRNKFICKFPEKFVLKWACQLAYSLNEKQLCQEHREDWFIASDGKIKQGASWEIFSS